jgi:cation diffusion facilitator CzcD-associated flavoprotein CzcO
LIVGAGVSGIGAAVRLKDEGVEDSLVLEKSGDIGGTWRPFERKSVNQDLVRPLKS